MVDNFFSNQSIVFYIIKNQRKSAFIGVISVLFKGGLIEEEICDNSNNKNNSA